MLIGIWIIDFLLKISKSSIIRLLYKSLFSLIQALLLQKGLIFKNSHKSWSFHLQKMYQSYCSWFKDILCRRIQLWSSKYAERECFVCGLMVFWMQYSNFWLLVEAMNTYGIIDLLSISHIHGIYVIIYDAYPFLNYFPTILMKWLTILVLVRFYLLDYTLDKTWFVTFVH